MGNEAQVAGKRLMASGTVAALLAGYGALDAFDKVPGILTTAPPNQVRSVTVDGKKHAQLVPADFRAPEHKQTSAPSSAAVRQAMQKSLKNAWWSDTVAITIRDADTGKVLAEHDSSKATEPASITKMASAFAIAHSKLPLNKRLQTRTLLDGNTLTLVAGGDMTLARDKGDVSKVAGHAGLGDLAEQTAQALKKQGKTSVTLNTNTQYAQGPTKAPKWGDNLFEWGFTAQITTLALADDRADNKTPAAKNPTKNAADAFVDALKKRGIKATYGKGVTDAPRGTPVGQVESAPVLDLLGLALQDSDNAMVESLTRQAAILDGVKPDPASVGAWVVQQVKKQGVNTSGMTMQDTSGLSEGTRIPVRVIGDLLGRGTSGQDAAYARVLTHLPVAAWNGTLHNRFLREPAHPGNGLVRAKTGSLVGVSSLAGTALTPSNHKLVFVVTANGNQPQGPDGVKAAIDEFAASLSQVK